MIKQSIVLSTVLLVAACGKSGGGSQAVPKTLAETSPAELQASEDADVRQLRKLLTEERPNVALALFVGEALSREQRALVAESMAELDLKSLQSLISDMVETNRVVRARYLYHGHPYQNSPAFLYKTIGHQGLETGGNFGFKAQLTLGVIRYVRSKALDQIVETYDARSKALAKELAPKFAAELLKSNPAKASEIEQLVARNVDPEVIKQKISDALLQIAPVAEMLGESNLSRGDKGVLFGTGVLAGGVYFLVKDHKEFKKIVSTVQDVRETIEQVQKKYKEFTALTVSLEKHATSSIGHFRSFQENITAASLQLKQLADSSLGSAPGARGVHSRRIADFIDARLRGRSPGQGSQVPSEYIQTASAINTRLARSVDAIGGMASSLDGIIGTSMQMANLLGVKLSPDLQKTLKTAQTVASMVSMGSKAFEMFQTGGLSAAMGVLGGGSPLGDANTVRFDRIDAKLDEVLANQKIIMELQQQTMKMIKDVAVMIDEYHESEMKQLAVIRNYNIITLEMAKAGILHKDIASCEQMVRFHLATPWPTKDFDIQSYNNWPSVDLLQERMNNALTGLAGIRKLVTSNGVDDYKNCKQAMRTAFGTDVARGNPLSYIFESDEKNELLSFSSSIYAPLLSELREQADGLSLQASGLHHPMATIADLQFKADLLPRKGAAGATTGSDVIYGLDQLVSLKNTERYLTSLILLYPIFEVEKDVWMQDLRSIVDGYLRSTGPGAGQVSPALYLLTGALKVVQTAISQEALLAGEPIIPGLFSKHHRQLLGGGSCKGETEYVAHNRSNNFFCFLRTNKQLMTNYLQYVLIKNGFGRPEQRSFYDLAYTTGDLSKLSEFLGADVKVELNAAKKPVVKLSAVKTFNADKESYELELPTADELVNPKVLYSEKLRTLLGMQDRIITELEKLHPVRRDLDVDSMLTMWGIQ